MNTYSLVSIIYWMLNFFQSSIAEINKILAKYYIFFPIILMT